MTIETITLTEAIKRYSPVLTIEQIIVLRQFGREFLYSKVKVEPGMTGTTGNAARDTDKLSI